MPEHIPAPGAQFYSIFNDFFLFTETGHHYSFPLMPPVKRKHQHGISPHRPSVPGPVQSYPGFLLCYISSGKSHSAPVWLYDVIRGINLLIIVITIVVIPLLPVLLR